MGEWGWGRFRKVSGAARTKPRKLAIVTVECDAAVLLFSCRFKRKKLIEVTLQMAIQTDLSACAFGRPCESAPWAWEHRTCHGLLLSSLHGWYKASA